MWVIYCGIVSLSNIWIDGFEINDADYEDNEDFFVSRWQIPSLRYVEARSGKQDWVDMRVGE